MSRLSVSFDRCSNSAVLSLACWKHFFIRPDSCSCRWEPPLPVLCQSLHSCLWDAVCKQSSCFLLKTSSWNCQVSTCLSLGLLTAPPCPDCCSPSCSEHQLLKTWCQRSWNAALDRFGAGCLYFHPFPDFLTARSFTLPKQVEQLVRSLGRARSWECLFWGNALLMLLSGCLSCTENWQKVNKITFLGPQAFVPDESYFYHKF